MKPARTARELFSEAINWSFKPECFVAHTSSPTGGVYVYEVLPEQLRDIHPLLPETLSTMLLSHKTRYVQKKQLDQTLQLWLDNKQMLTLKNERYRVFHVTSVSPIVEHGYVKLAIYGGAIATFTHDGMGEVPYVCSVNWHGLDIDNAEMERHYPGWSARLQVGSELGLAREELCDYVCATPAAAPTVMLPAVDLSSSVLS